MLGVLVVAMALALAPAGSAIAKPKRNLVDATVNGKRLKWKGRYVVASAGGSGVILAAGAPPRRGIVRGIGFGCPVSLTGVSFPLAPDPTNCNGTYTETKVGRHPIIKAWTELQGVQVVYASFDGTTMTGTFSAVMDPVPGNGAGPVTIAGEFRAKVSAGR